MDSITLVRFGIDALLSGSVIYCAVRMLKSSASASHVRRIQELEGTIRELIREADSAGQNLQDSLDRRQKNLDRTLTELEALEAKNSKALEQAQDFIRSVDSSVSRAKGDLREIAQTAQQIIQKTQNEVRFVQNESEQIMQKTQIRETVPSPVSYHVKPEPITSISLDSVIDESPEPPSFSKEATLKQNSMLRSKIERENISSDPEIDLAEVQRLATELLNAGRDIEYVAARTRMPIEEVQKLTGRRQRQPREERPAGIDPRLGALGAMRRVTQTL